MRVRWAKGRGAKLGFCAVVAGFLLLFIPDAAPPLPLLPSAPFVWRQDSYWTALEAQLQEARPRGCEGLAKSIEKNLADLNLQLERIEQVQLPADAAEFREIETNLFQAAPMIAVCEERLTEFLQIYSRMRTALKRQSIHWPVEAEQTRERLYRSLYGGRAAVEEVMLQASAVSWPALLRGEEEASSTPSVSVMGVRWHSGDILLSRGGAATSALIARGNDFPGNFSHVALAYVDSVTTNVSIIESHIECGVTVTPLEKYLADTKLRIMVLRLRSDLTKSDPMLPHRAALQALQEATNSPVAYDFAMDQNDASKKFCCEVASWAYRPFGIHLWSIGSRLSSPGTTAWLASLGVRHFQSQEPADLEYDPQLVVVAEWRDPKTLFKDHLHNAIIDVLLERAERGEAMDYAWVRLPLARAAKAYSFLLNQFDGVGPIPEGMSATTALRVDWLRQTHAKMEARLRLETTQFQTEHGYAAPYWEIVRLAREQVAAHSLKSL